MIGKAVKLPARKSLATAVSLSNALPHGAAYFGADAIEREEVWGANAYISTNEFDENGESRFEVVSYEPAKMKYHWETFKMTAELWRRSEKYDPRKN